MSFCFPLCNNMIRIERQAKIIQILREREYIENSELTRLFNVTQATIRRDLKALSKQGLVRTDHGGASVASPSHVFEEPLYETKVFVNHEAKQAIGMAAAALVRDGDSILLDSGNQKLAVKELGGTGRTHDWTLSRTIRERIEVPLFLAGGLTAENVAEAIAAVQPFGLDLCSGVRTAGKLDGEKLGCFFAAVKASA